MFDSRCIFVIILIFFTSQIFGQQEPTSSTVDTIPQPTQALSQVSLSTKSSVLAVSLSAVLPGAGQIYNEEYWKVLFIWGLGSYWAYEWTRNNKWYQDYRSLYSKSITPQTPDGDYRYLQLRDFYRDERDAFAWYLAALYFLNILDAYVGASLYDFDVSPDLSIEGRIMPTVSVSIRFQF